jgi:hypothetical protein
MNVKLQTHPSWQKHRNDRHKKSFPRSTLWSLGVQEQCTIPASGDKDRTQLVGQSPGRSLNDVGNILTSKDLNRPPLTSRHLAASACSATAFPTSKANLSMKLSTPQLNHHASSGVQIIRFFVCLLFLNCGWTAFNCGLMLFRSLGGELGFSLQLRSGPPEKK